jgi:hypothetical protein
MNPTNDVFLALCRLAIGHRLSGDMTLIQEFLDSQMSETPEKEKEE